MTNTLSEDARKDQTELLSRFVLWSLDVLAIQVQPRPDGVYTVQLPADLGSADVQGSGVQGSGVRGSGVRGSGVRGTGEEGLECVELAFGVDGEHAERVQTVAIDSPIFQWLRQQLASRGEAVHAAPAIQPRSVHELTRHLFAAYRFDQGNIHLGGCTLEDRPLLRFTYATTGTDEVPGRLWHDFRTTGGQPIPPALIESLHLDQLVALSGKPPVPVNGEIRRWIEAAKVAPSDGDRPPERDQLVATTVVWCKYAEGTIVFSAGEQSLEVAFSGLAQLLATHELVPPPARCPGTGKTSYTLALTDDGRVTVADAIESCEVSGKRVLATELQGCPVTGRRALPEYFDACAVSGKQVLRDALQTCTMCGQAVAPETADKGICGGCRRLRAIRKDDPRIARVLGEHPKLDRWRNWKISETGRTYILLASVALRRLLLVVDQETLEPSHLATGNRFFQRFTPLPESQWAEYLKGR